MATASFDRQGIRFQSIQEPRLKIYEGAQAHLQLFCASVIASSIIIFG